MSRIPTITEDESVIFNISFGSGTDSMGYEVGVNGVAKITAYWDQGPAGPMPMFAVFIGEFVVARVPAYMVFITYQPPGGMQ